MKKVLLSLVVILLCVTLVACNSGSNPAPTPTGGDDAQTTTPPADTKPVEIAIAHLLTPDAGTNLACIELKNYLETESGGQIKVTLFPNGELGDDAQMIEGLFMGTIQMYIPNTSPLTNYSEKFGVLDLPYLFKSKEAAFAALDGELGDLLNADLEGHGLICFGYNYDGARHMTNNVRPIHSPADLQGLNMRVMQSEIYINMFKALGANPIPISFSELYTALSQNTVDGQENAASGIYEVKFYEVQKHMSLTAHTLSFGANLMNKDFYDSLSPELQQLVAEGTRKYLVDYQRELNIAAEDELIQKLRETNIEVTEISPEAMTEFMTATQSVRDAYVDKIGQDVFSIVDKYNQ